MHLVLCPVCPEPARGTPVAYPWQAAGAKSVRRCERKLMDHPELGLRSRTRQELTALVPEYLLAGHLIDRAGMPHLIGALGRDTMRDIAIDEWRGASPVYTKRMQRALGFEGDSVETLSLIHISEP